MEVQLGRAALLHESFKNPDFGAPCYSSVSWRGQSSTVRVKLVAAVFLPQPMRMEKRRAGGVQGEGFFFNEG